MNERESDLVRDFYRYLCQTSDGPMGLVIERAQGCFLYGLEGREYLDFISGIAVSAAGHGHPTVLAALEEQIRRHLHVMVYGEYIQEAQVTLARRLAEIAPGELSVTFLCNSGAEAVDGALKLARKRTGRPGFVAFEGAYHGDTWGALSVGGMEQYQKPFVPLLPGVRVLPWDDLDALTGVDEEVAAVIVEPIQAEAGVRVPGPAFLPTLRRRCSEVGALVICDEVQTGFGRTGRWFACEHWGITPDILVMAKGMGGGLPLGGFMGSTDLMRTLSEDPPFCHVTTFGGHPASCAAAVATLQVIQAEGLLANAEARGRDLREGLTRIGEEQGGIREVRGRGLLLGLEMESPRLAEAVRMRALEKGLILGSVLDAPAVLRVAPPLILSPALVERALAIIEESLREVLS